MPIELIAKLKPKNSQTFPLIDVEDIDPTVGAVGDGQGLKRSGTEVIGFDIPVDTDILFKTSASDTSAGYAVNKLSGGGDITITEQSGSGVPANLKVTENGSNIDWNAQPTGINANRVIEDDNDNTYVWKSNSITGITRPISTIYANQKIYVAGGRSVYVIKAGKINTIIPVGLFLDNYFYDALCYNPAKNKIYCINYYQNTLTIIDGSNDTIITTLGILRPTAICYNSTDVKIYIARNLTGGSSEVYVIDGSTDEFINYLDAGDNPVALLYNPTQNKIYCANYGSNNVTVIESDVLDDKVIDTVSVGTNPIALCYNSTEDTIYVANYDSNNVTVISGVDESIVATIDAYISELGRPNSLCYNETDNKIYVGTADTVFVVIIDGNTNTLIGEIENVNYCKKLIFNFTDDKIYCSLAITNGVSIINGSTDTLITLITVGLQPYSLAHDTDNDKIYVANYGSNTLNIIDGVTDELPEHKFYITIKDGSSFDWSSEKTGITTSYAEYYEEWITPPSGGSWTKAKIDALEIGIHWGSEPTSMIGDLYNIEELNLPPSTTISKVRVYVKSKYLSGWYLPTDKIHTTYVYLKVYFETNWYLLIESELPEHGIDKHLVGSARISFGLDTYRPTGVNYTSREGRLYYATDLPTPEEDNGQELWYDTGIEWDEIILKRVRNIEVDATSEENALAGSVLTIEEDPDTYVKKLYYESIPTPTLISSEYVDIGKNAYDIAYNPTNNKIYVAVQGGTSDVESIWIFDSVSNEYITKVDLSAIGKPYKIYWESHVNKLFVCCEDDDKIVVINGTLNTIIDTLTWTGTRPRAICSNDLSGDDNKVYFALYTSDQVRIINGNTLAVIVDKTTGVHPNDLLFNPDDDKVYCACYNNSDRYISIIDSSNDITNVSISYQPSKMCLDTVQNYIFIGTDPSSYANSVIEVLKCSDNSHTTHIDTGERKKIHWELGKMCYVSTQHKVYCPITNDAMGNDYVVIIDTDTLLKITNIDIGAKKAYQCVHNSVSDYVYCNVSSRSRLVQINCIDETIKQIVCSSKPKPLCYNADQNKLYASSSSASTWNRYLTILQTFATHPKLHDLLDDNNHSDTTTRTGILGDVIAFGTTWDRVSGNITTTRKFLRQLGTSVVSALPDWDTVTKTDVGLSTVENTALSTWAGTSNITTLGTITTGVWSGTVILPAKGGTGVVNGSNNTLTFTGNYSLGLTLTNTTALTLPTSGTLATTSQLHNAVTISDTDTVDLTLSTQALSADIKKQMSITSDSSGIKLDGDSASPGNTKLYGTNVGGTKGWYDQPSGGSVPSGTAVLLYSDEVDDKGSSSGTMKKVAMPTGYFTGYTSIKIESEVYTEVKVGDTALIDIIYWDGSDENKLKEFEQLVNADILTNPFYNIFVTTVTAAPAGGIEPDHEIRINITNNDVSWNCHSLRIFGIV